MDFLLLLCVSSFNSRLKARRAALKNMLQNYFQIHVTVEITGYLFEYDKIVSENAWFKFILFRNLSWSWQIRLHLQYTNLETFNYHIEFQLKKRHVNWWDVAVKLAGWKMGQVCRCDITDSPFKLVAVTRQALLCHCHGLATIKKVQLPPCNYEIYFKDWQALNLADIFFFFEDWDDA